MSGSIRRQQIQWILIASTVTLALYYVLVLRPLAETAVHLDQPLQDAWRQLERTGVVTAEGESIHQPDLHARLRNAEAALSRMREVTNTVRQLVALNREVSDNLERPFQLIEFEIERQDRIEELLELATTENVSVTANLPFSFPEFNNETRDAPLLWGQLSVLYHALGLAIHSRVGTISDVKVLPVRVYDEPGLAVRELPFELTFSGSMSNVSTFLLNLPLREEQIRAEGGPKVFAWKPAMFIDSLMIRKSSPERPDEVRVDLRFCGFVLRGIPPAEKPKTP